MSRFQEFLRAEVGAITVDWAVLASAGVGATFGVVVLFGESLGFISNKANIELFEQTASEGTFTFDFGPGTWTGQDTAFVPGFGYVLGPIPGSGGAQTVTNTVALPPGLGTVELNFDLLAFDSLDNENGVFYVNDTAIGHVSASAGDMSWTSYDVENVDVEIEILVNGEAIGGYQTGDEWWWKDGAAEVTIVVKNPGDAVKFGFGSTANQGVDDESWGIDNWNVSGSFDTPTDGGDPVTDTDTDAGTGTTTVTNVADTVTGLNGVKNNGGKNKGNNGWGNGDQSAPGGSAGNNNAENSDTCHKNHGCGNAN